MKTTRYDGKHINEINLKQHQKYKGCKLEDKQKS